jgi:penicillin-binding protein 1C
VVLVVVVLWGADRVWPLPLPQDDLARVVLAEDGTPLWRFADANGVWRYPVQTHEVSPYYLDALLTYEDRWFYQHPGVNPLALARATWQNLTGARVVSGGQHLVDAGGAVTGSAFAHLPWQVASAVAHGAAGMAPVQGRNP